MMHEQKDSLINLKRLSANDDYYSIVFKKTERIASAVFYILSYVEINDTTRVHHSNLSDKAMLVHVAVSDTLILYQHEASDKIFSLQHALVVLQSTLELALAGRLISTEVLTSISDEIDLVLRYLHNHYSEGATVITPTNQNTLKRPLPVAVTRRKRPAIPKNDFSSDAVLVYSDLNDRTTRIKTVLEAKPDATIKDLSDIITDVSTKTIQRDLNSLIENGEVIREGERRWSKYSLVK